MGVATSTFCLRTEPGRNKPDSRKKTQVKRDRNISRTTMYAHCPVPGQQRGEVQISLTIVVVLRYFLFFWRKTPDFILSHRQERTTKPSTFKGCCWQQLCLKKNLAPLVLQYTSHFHLTYRGHPNTTRFCRYLILSSRQRVTKWNPCRPFHRAAALLHCNALYLVVQEISLPSSGACPSASKYFNCNN